MHLIFDVAWRANAKIAGEVDLSPLYSRAGAVTGAIGVGGGVVGGIAGFVATTGGTVAVTSLFGVSGAAVISKKMEKRVLQIISLLHLLVSCLRPPSCSRRFFSGPQCFERV